MLLNLLSLPECWLLSKHKKISLGHCMRPLLCFKVCSHLVSAWPPACDPSKCSFLIKRVWFSETGEDDWVCRSVNRSIVEATVVC